MSLFDILSQVASGDTTRTIGQRIGADPQTTQTAIGAALPALMAALARNASDSGGASSLASALDRDHDGSILDDIGGFLGGGGGATSAGDAILGHVLGSQRSNVETGVQRASGLNSSQVSQLLALLAPVVLGVLGKQKREKGLDSSGLQSWMQGQAQTMSKQAPGAMSAVERMLDRDGDGQVGDELLELGSNLLGGLFGGRK